ncbi:hypothetical protein ACFSTC_53080 [Nonomuraea ferruginea]
MIAFVAWSSPMTSVSWKAVWSAAGEVQAGEKPGDQQGGAPEGEAATDPLSQRDEGGEEQHRSQREDRVSEGEKGGFGGVCEELTVGGERLRLGPPLLLRGEGGDCAQVTQQISGAHDHRPQDECHTADPPSGKERFHGGASLSETGRAITLSIVDQQP